MGTRGVLYIVWGNKADRALQRGIASVAKVHPELPVEVVRLGEDVDFHAKAKIHRPSLMNQ